METRQPKTAIDNGTEVNNKIKKLEDIKENIKNIKSKILALASNGRPIH